MPPGSPPMVQGHNNTLPIDADLLLSLFRKQKVLACGDAFYKQSQLRTQKRYYVELRGSTMVMFRNSQVAANAGTRLRDIVGVLILEFYEVNVEKKQGQSPRIHVSGPDLDQGQSLYIKATTEKQLADWLQALAVAKAIVLPGLTSMTVESIIGQGGGGKVFLVRHNEKRENYALKVIDKKHALSSANALKHIVSERILMEIIGDHPFVLPMKFAFQSQANLFIGTPFCGGGDLATFLKNQWKRHGTTSPESIPENGQRRRYGGHLSERATRLLVAEMLLALGHLHARGIVYRDLKPENVFIAADGHIRLGDFGLAKSLMPSRLGDGFVRTSSICGTRNYLPPEMLFGKLYGLEVDMWSLGVMVFRIMCGRFPFEAKQTKEMFSKVKREKIKYPVFLSADAISLLEGLLCRDQSKRLTVETAKKHPFFDGLDWNALLEKRLESPIANTSLGRDPVDPTDELANFDLSKLQGISLGEYVPEGENGMQLDADPQCRMNPEGRIFGFAYALPDDESSTPDPLPVTTVRSSGLLKRISSSGSIPSLDGSPVKQSSSSLVKKQSSSSLVKKQSSSSLVKQSSSLVKQVSNVGNVFKDMVSPRGVNRRTSFSTAASPRDDKSRLKPAASSGNLPDRRDQSPKLVNPALEKKPSPVGVQDNVALS